MLPGCSRISKMLIGKASFAIQPALRIHRALFRKRSFNSNSSARLLKDSVRRLQVAGVPDAAESVRWLCEASKGDLTRFDDSLMRRLKREPLQYIIGEWDFHNISVLVRPPVLIPRPETEELVDFVLNHMPSTNERTRFLDIGTGTGAIGLALLQARPLSNCTALDCDAGACALAQENAQLLGSGARFKVLHLDMRDFHTADKYDLVVSNPPYIPSSNLASLQAEVALFESPVALDGGSADGSFIPKAVLLKATQVLRKGGQLFMELHDTHEAGVVAGWIAAAHELKSLKLLESKCDFAGVQRFHRVVHQG